MNKNISKTFADSYDTYSSENHWYSPEVLFGLSYEYIRPDNNLLDIGIGTGLSSDLFHRAGLSIYGIDSSEHMIAVCKSKHLAHELKVHDIADLPLPYGDTFFDIVIANGIFHLTGEIDPLFSEIYRLLQKNGILAFTTDPMKRQDQRDYSETDTTGVWRMHNDEHDFWLYKHTDDYIYSLIHKKKFTLLKSMEFCAFRSIAEKRDVHFQAYIIHKTK
ncbi:class I SAM-dependent methyltransferase [candidate division KSB1 bacterium]|nr:class I SAM-dependent methyltransferase [candidate division KSB1 bacterium]